MMLLNQYVKFDQFRPEIIYILTGNNTNNQRDSHLTLKGYSLCYSDLGAEEFTNRFLQTKVIHL